MSRGRAIGCLIALLLFGVVGWMAYDGWRRLGGDAAGNDEIERIDVEAALQPDGALAVRTTYRFHSPVASFGVFLPDGAVNPRMNGRPVDGFVRFEGPVGEKTVVIEWDVRGRTVRSADGAVVSWPLSRSLISVVRDTTKVPLRAVLYLPNGPATAVTSSLADQQQLVQPGALLLSGRIGAWSDSDAVALVDATAVPGVPLDDRRISAAQAYGGAAAALRAGRPGTDVFEAERTFHLVATLLLTVVGGLFFFVYLLGLVRPILQAIAGRARGLGQRCVPPDGALPPTLVGVAIGSAGRGERSLVAATILELVGSGGVDIEGITSEQYVLRVTADPASVASYRRVVLAALRAEAGAPVAGAPVELTGPPLWSVEKPKALRPYRRAVVGEARSAGLVSTVFSGTSLFVMTIVCGMLGAIATQSGWGVVLATVGPWLALLAVLSSGMALTKKGRLVQSQAQEYARYLRESSELAEVGAPGVVLWGETLALGAAIGAAPKTAEALSPRLSRKG